MSAAVTRPRAQHVAYQVHVGENNQRFQWLDMAPTSRPQAEQPCPSAAALPRATDSPILRCVIPRQVCVGTTCVPPRLSNALGPVPRLKPWKLQNVRSPVYRPGTAPHVHSLRDRLPGLGSPRTRLPHFPRRAAGPRRHVARQAERRADGSRRDPAQRRARPRRSRSDQARRRRDEDGRRQHEDRDAGSHGARPRFCWRRSKRWSATSRRRARKLPRRQQLPRRWLPRPLRLRPSPPRRRRI